VPQRTYTRRTPMFLYRATGWKVSIPILIPIATQLISAFCWIIYGSFFEWYWHKLWMHSPRFPKEAFHGHTVVHHGLYKGDQSYFVSEEEHPEHILLKAYALPGLVLAHLPALYLIDRYLVHNTMAGGFIATLLYFVVYEYTHYNMHVPRHKYIERYAWFQFLRNHHKLHHKYFQKNFCVLFPLADLALGTLITDKSIARKKAEREAAIESGQIQEERKPKHGRKRERTRTRLVRFNSVKFAKMAKMSPLAQEFARFKTRRSRPGRRYRKVGSLRELLKIGKNRDDK